MRFSALVIAAVAAASWSCTSSSSGGGPKLPSEDYSATFTGWWIGAQAGTVDGVPVPPSVEGMEITREDANRLRIGDACPDGSSVPAVVVGPISISVPAFTCPVAAIEGCASVTMMWTRGTGALDSGLLSLEMIGTLAGCGRSLAVVLDFEALRDAQPPQIATLSPASAAVRDPGLTLTLSGTGFAPKALVRFGGATLPTAFVSASELRATVPASALAFAAVVTVVVTNVDAQTSIPVQFEVRNPRPVLATVAPDPIVAGTPGATVTINGSGFVPTSSASSGGSSRATTYVAPTRLMVALTAEDLALAGERAVTVTNPAPGGGTSDPLVVHVVNPAPVPTGISPESIAAGAPRSFVSVMGSRFVPGATVRWSGTPRRTHFASPTLLSAEILASDVATPGSAEISVENPPPGGGTAVAGTVTVATPTAAVPRSVAYQLDPAHSGHTSAGGTLSFPTGNAWSVPLPDLVSYPLVADGKVFVLVRGPDTGVYGTRLYALDLATGTTVWGPVAISGTYFWAGHAYDAGRIFVVSFDGRLSAFDAATGAAGWSVSLPGQYAFSAAPSAAGGIVYVGGAGSGGTVYAVDAGNGTVRWTQSVANGDESSPAVAPDAVYVSYPCQVYKLDRLTGATIWHRQTGCSGGGGKTAAYADGDLYVRDYRAAGEPVGAVHDAFDGSVSGTFGTYSYLPIPAVAGGVRYVLVGGVLERWERDAAKATWAFAGDGKLASAPIVIDDAVVVGSGSGKVFAVDAVTGLERWSGDAGAAVLGPDEQNVSQPLTGLGAGEGYLVVPAGKRVTAWRIVGP